jgi:flagellar basal body-associated protein FliL
MAELEVVTQEATPEEPPETPASPGPGRAVKLAVVAGAVALGLTAGVLGLAPAFLPSKAAAPGVGHDEGHAAMGGGGEVFEIKNMVTNPAGAEGIHFIMATVSFQSHDRQAAEFLRNNEALVKDTVVGTLASLTMEDLSRSDARDRIKTLIAGRAGELVHQPGAFTVYLPEFVVQ